MKSLSFVKCIIFITLVCNIAFAQNAMFQALGDLSGGDFNSSAQCVSADGSIVAGKATTDSGKMAFVWSRETGMVALGNFPDFSLKQSLVTDISADGSVIVGWGNISSQLFDDAGQRGFVWTAENGMQWIGRPDSAGTAQGVSADGGVVVGEMGGQAYRWTQTDGIQMLGILDGCNYSSATAVSDDGEIITGSCSRVLYEDEVTFIWTRDGGMKSLGYLPNDVNSFPNAISPDGAVIAGSSYDIYTREKAYHWTEDAGMVRINHLPGRNVTHPSDLSYNGEIIVGGSFKDESGVFTETAFIWDNTNGTRDFQSVLLADYGLNIPGWSLSSALGISHNGNVIVGSGTNPSGEEEAFRIVLDTTLVIDYFGQTPPGKTAQVFAPGIISLEGRWESKIVFSPDGSQAFIPSSDGLLYSKCDSSTWSELAVAPFFTDLNVSNPAFSADGSKLYFSRFSSDYTEADIWMVERTNDGWSDPQKLAAPVNSTSLEQGYTESFDGTIYVDSKRAGGNGGWDIWCIRQLENETLQAENMGPIFNTTSDDAEPCIAPDGSYLVFSSHRNGNIGDMDLCVSFRKDNEEWTTPVNLEAYGDGINIPNGYTMKPTISPDGKFLFFHQHDTSYSFGDIYWVSTSIIEDARNAVLSGVDGPKSENQIPAGFRLYQNYPNPFNPTTNIQYSFEQATPAIITVYNTMGQKVKKLVDTFHQAGEYSVTWNGTDENNNPVSSGIYFCQLKTNEQFLQLKMLYIQ